MIWHRVMQWLREVTGRARRRRLEEELLRADAEIARLRALLAEALRPPMQFARMREREVAIRRLTRLLIAREGRGDVPTKHLAAAGIYRAEIDRS